MFSIASQYLKVIFKNDEIFELKDSSDKIIELIHFINGTFFQTVN